MIQIIRPGGAKTIASGTFNRWFEPLAFGGPRPFGANSSLHSTFPIDVTETNSTVNIIAEIPGFNKSNIRVEIEDNKLQIEAIADESIKNKDDEYLLQERQVGSLKRTLKLPIEIDSANSSSSYKNGILEITLPKEEKAQLKQITVD
tara:strand:+ start:3747 stop:4187 length:441 start_codon:yes stop_codon:yes gene_type:complete